MKNEVVTGQYFTQIQLNYNVRVSSSGNVGTPVATVEENLAALSGLCGVRVSISSGEEVYLIPKPRPELNKLFNMTNTPPPTILPAGKTNADTKRKLKKRRK